jgi:hypothetical protein
MRCRWAELPVFDENTNFKLEYRYDAANQPVFVNASRGDYRKSNQLFGASVVVRF